MPNVLRVGINADADKVISKSRLRLSLIMSYGGREYHIAENTIMVERGNARGTVMHFKQNAVKHVAGDIYKILLGTGFDRRYTAKGVVYSTPPEQPSITDLGDDLEIIVEELAEKAIQSLREYTHAVHAEKEERIARQGILRGPLGIQYSLN